MIRQPLISGVILGLLAGGGCSSETRVESIQGKAPADYREEVEKGLSHVVPESPAKAKAGARKGR